MFVALAIFFALLMCTFAALPFFVKSYQEILSEGAVAQDIGQIEKIQEQILKQMIRDEKFLEGKSLSEQEFRRRQQTLTYRYIDYARRLDSLKENEKS